LVERTDVGDGVMSTQRIAVATEAVFHMHEITKVYRMRDVEVHALRQKSYKD
jgi:hypothetical protein